MAPYDNIQSKKTVEKIKFKVIVLGEPWFQIQAHYPHYGRVGYATISPVDESTWRVDEFLVADDIPTRWQSQLRIGRWSLGGKSKTISFRNRGIGTALMDFVKQYVRQHGAKEIETTPPHRDLEHTSQLLGWYRKQGFKIAVRAPDSGSGVAARLVWRPTEKSVARAA